MEKTAESEPAFVRALKEAIWASELSIKELSDLCGVAQSQLSRFLRGERTITLPTAAVLYEFLGFKLIPPKRTRKKHTESADE